MSTALYLLRCIQLGLSLAELDALEYGDIIDMFTEAANDEYKYRQLATQEDFDKF